MKKKSKIKKAERLEIAILLNKKRYSYRDIAESLGRSPNTISYEINNNSVKGRYYPIKAHHKAKVKRKYAKYEGMKIVSNIGLRSYVEEKIKQDWSPELISGRIKYVEKDKKYISTTGIYKYIYSVYGRQLEQYLRRRGKKLNIRSKQIKKKIRDRTFIDERPKIVEKRSRYGDWEGDLMVSGKNGTGVLVVLYERKSRYVLIRKILSLDTHTVNLCIYEMIGGFIANSSLTIDNDISFQKHKELSEKIGVPIFFCHPYHSWEKGGVESMNGLIRRYIKKGSDISKYTDKYIQEVQDKLNNRPRKCLRFKTPGEILKENNLLNEEIVKMRTNYVNFSKSLVS